MGHVFRAKSFIRDATALANGETDGRGTIGISDEVENYLTANDTGGGAVDIDEVISISSCKLKGDKVFTLVVIEDDVAGG